MLIFGDRTGFTLLTTTDSKVAYKHFFKRGKCGSSRLATESTLLAREKVKKVSDSAF